MISVPRLSWLWLLASVLTAIHHCVLALWLPGPHTIRAFPVHWLSLSQTLAGSHGGRVWGKPWEDICCSSVLLWCCRKHGGGDGGCVSDGLSGSICPAAISAPLGPRMLHRALCENISLGLLMGSGGTSPALRSSNPSERFYHPNPQGLEFPSAIQTNNLLSCFLSCFSSSPAKIC